jgi:rhodanese-related sulfurtransferase
MRLMNLLLAVAAALPLAAAADQGIPHVTTDELKRMLDAKEDLVLANALSPIEYAEEHIAGSVNVPYEALRNGKVKLPQDRNKRIVFYCKGPK